MNQKSIILIDAENVFRGWKAYCNTNNLNEKIDYVKLVKEISQDTLLIRAYFYDGVIMPIRETKKSFLESLQMQGFEIKTKRILQESFNCEYCNKESIKLIQKGIDIAIATDIIRHSMQQSTDICILVSGDEDFLDAVRFVKDRGTRVWVVSFNKSISKELRLSVDKFILMEEIFDKVKSKNR